MRRARAAAVLPALLAVGLAVDGALLLRVRAESGSLRRAASPLRSGARAAIPTLLGFSVLGRAIPAERGSARCLALRFESAGCPYCRYDDAHAWARLAPALLRLGCSVAIILPEPEEAVSATQRVPRQAPEVAFVGTRLVSRFRFSATPATLLFGPGGRYLWGRVGELDPRADRAALMALRARLASGGGR